MKNLSLLFPLDLQCFSEEGQGQGPGGNEGGAAGQGTGNQGGNGQGLSLDAVQAWLNQDESGKKWLQSHSDSFVTKAIKTYEEKTLPKKIDEEIAKRYPPETEEQKQLRELKEQFEQEKKLRVHTELKNKAIAVATEKGLPTGLVDFFVGADEDITLANLGTLEQVFNTAVQTSVEAKFKQSGRQPHDSGNQNPGSLQKQLEDAAERARRTGRDEDMAVYSALKLQMMQSQQK